MNLNIIITTATNKFKQKMNDFCQNTDFSQLSAESAEFLCSALKESFSFAGKSAYKTFVESFNGEKPSIKQNGKVMKLKHISVKEFLTPFGATNIERNLYQSDRGGQSYIPLDTALDMCGEYATPEVRESVLYSSALMTPEEASSLLSKCSMFNPSATAIKHMITNAGKIMEENAAQINTEIRKKEKIPEKTKAVVISMDGVNVLLNEPGIKKGRPTERPKLGHQNNDKTSFRNAMVGSISFYDKIKGKADRIESKYAARMPEDKFPTFKNQFEEEVSDIFKKLNHNVKKILIMDGHKSLEGYVKGHALYENCTPLLDFFHCMEHLSKASEAIFGKSNKDAQKWYNKYRLKLLEEDGAAESAYRSMKNYYEKIPKVKRKLLKIEITYFKRQKHLMAYAKFIERGLPIGSGPIEAACKSIVKTRMCRSGMRWSRKGGQNILQLRTYVKSNRWEPFWEQYKNLKKCA